MRFPIPKLIRDVCDHYEISPSQLMPNAWRVLMSLESISIRHGVECEIGEVLFSYYLKEHDKDKGRYKMITRVGRAPIITCLRTNDRGWKDRFLFVRGELVWGPSGPGGASHHWRATSLPSGLIAEERTRQLLEVAVAERDYRVALSETNLRSSRLWAFVEESQDMVKGKLGIPSAKEAKALLEGAASSSQKKSKRKRPQVDTRVIDDPEGYKQSKIEAASVAAAGARVSPDLSPAKSAKRAKSKSSEGKGTLTVSLPADGSAYSDPSFVRELSETLLLPADRKRLVDIGPVQSVEWSMAHLYQERRNVDLAASNTSLRKANADLTAEREDYSSKITELKSRNEELGDNYAKLVRVNEKLTGELDAAKEDLVKEKADSSSLREELEAAMLKVQSIAVDAVLSARTELMEEFKRGKHAAWDPDQEIETWRKREAVLAAGEDESDADEEEAPAAGSPKTQEAVTDPGRVEPDAGAETTAPEAEDVAASAEDIAKD
ncbi:hypothetical protein UlMin_028905 [Ulmus minor]